MQKKEQVFNKKFRGGNPDGRRSGGGGGVVSGGGGWLEGRVVVTFQSVDRHTHEC